MNTPDEHIDSVLHALGSAEPPPGFEGRVKHAVQNAAKDTPRRSIRMYFALASALLVCVVAVGVGMRTRSSTSSSTSIKPFVPVPGVSRSQRPTNVVAAAHKAQPIIRPHTRKLIASEPVVAVQPDMLTHENMPAPPLPLTAEERLVIRMMHHDHSPQLAQLTPDARARSLHDDAEAYRAFFAPQPPLDGQPIYEQHISGGSQ